MPWRKRCGKTLERRGGPWYRHPTTFSGIERSLVKKIGGVAPVLLIADTLRLFGHGTKVAVEVSIMATDTGAISGKESTAVGGTAKGADTARYLKQSQPVGAFRHAYPGDHLQTGGF